MSTLIDSHCHIDFSDFDDDRQTVLAHCQQLNISDIIVPAVSRQSWPTLLSVCEQSPNLHPALGLHPMFMSEHQLTDIEALESAIIQYQPIAVGEIGLDFYDHKNNRSAQITLFTAQVRLAKKYDLPVILHVRKAHDEVLKVLRQIQPKGGTVHAFSGSQQQAEQYLGLGFKLGVGGALTYDRAKKLQRIFTTLPAEAIVLETDAPDMPLAGQQRQRNSPENIPLILHTLAQLRNEDEQQLAAITTDNCKQLFNLD